MATSKGGRLEVQAQVASTSDLLGDVTVSPGSSTRSKPRGRFAPPTSRGRFAPPEGIGARQSVSPQSRPTRPAPARLETRVLHEAETSPARNHRARLTPVGARELVSFKSEQQAAPADVELEDAVAATAQGSTAKHDRFRVGPPPPVEDSSPSSGVTGSKPPANANIVRARMPQLNRSAPRPSAVSATRADDPVRGNQSSPSSSPARRSAELRTEPVAAPVARSDAVLGAIIKGELQKPAGRVASGEPDMEEARHRAGQRTGRQRSSSPQLTSAVLKESTNQGLEQQRSSSPQRTSARTSALLRDILSGKLENQAGRAAGGERSRPSSRLPPGFKGGSRSRSPSPLPPGFRKESQGGPI